LDVRSGAGLSESQKVNKEEKRNKERNEGIKDEQKIIFGGTQRGKLTLQPEMLAGLDTEDSLS
jgi:hypothetical protein